MRHNLWTKHERLLRLEKATAERTITLTEEQTRVLERFSPEFRERHIEANEVKIETVLSDNGREFCGRPDQHPYELFLQLEDIAHRTTRVRRLQSNGILERFHRTLLDEHFRVEGRRTWFETIEEMQAVLDDYLEAYNTKRHHQGRGMNGRTPIRAFTEGMPKTSNTEVTSQTKTAKPKTA